MSSILTNPASMSALGTLKNLSKQLTVAQTALSTGLRISEAADNAAYWSISTTMRSDERSLSAIRDAMGLGAAQIDTAYSALSAVVDLMSEVNSRLIVAKDESVDKLKVQSELDQLKEQILSIATSATFAGGNWLNTAEPRDLNDLSEYQTHILASLGRSKDGTLSIGRIAVDLTSTSLFNVGGGGALQVDTHSLGSIGGFRWTDAYAHGHNGHQDYLFTGPATFDETDFIEFELLVDESHHSAGDAYTVRLDKDLIDQALGTTDGVIGSAAQMRLVLEQAFQNQGIPATAHSYWAAGAGIFEIGSTETSGHWGSSIAISNVTSSFPDGFALGLEDDNHIIDHDNMYPSWSFNFEGPFRVHREAVFDFELQLGDDPPSRVHVDRQIVDTVLGTDDGMVTTADALAAILQAVTQDHHLVVTTNGSSIILTLDEAVFPAGNRAPHLRLGDVQDNLGPRPDFDLLDLDITNPQNSIDNYLSGLDGMLRKVTTAAATLGSLKTRVALQDVFVSKLSDAISRGVGQLVDADMNRLSARLNALQVQEQLAVQALQVANANSQNILSLFR